MSEPVKVKATRDFSTEAVGSRAKGETFLYDADRDPVKLVRDGHVEVVGDSKPASSSSSSSPSGKASS